MAHQGYHKSEVLSIFKKTLAPWNSWGTWLSASQGLVITLTFECAPTTRSTHSLSSAHALLQGSVAWELLKDMSHPSHPPPLPAELRAQPGWKKSSQHGLSVPSTCPSSKAMLNGVTCHPVTGCCPSHRLSWQDTLCLGHPYNTCVKLLPLLICRCIDFHQQSSHFNFCVMQSIMCSKPPPGSLEPVSLPSSLALSNWLNWVQLHLLPTRLFVGPRTPKNASYLCLHSLSWPRWQHPSLSCALLKILLPLSLPASLYAQHTSGPSHAFPLHVPHCIIIDLFCGWTVNSPRKMTVLLVKVLMAGTQ